MREVSFLTAEQCIRWIIAILVRITHSFIGKIPIHYKNRNGNSVSLLPTYQIFYSHLINFTIIVLHTIFSVKDLTAADELKRGTTLPDDYDIPFTTHRASYRDPTLLNKRALNVASPIKHPNNLDPSGRYFNISILGSSPFLGNIYIW